jgi:hypothetical protein
LFSEIKPFRAGPFFEKKKKGGAGLPFTDRVSKTESEEKTIPSPFVNPKPKIRFPEDN